VHGDFPSVYKRVAALCGKRNFAAEARPFRVAARLVPQGFDPIMPTLANSSEQGEMAESGHAVGIIMGSQSDWETMQHAAQTLDRLGIVYETRIVSAHRTPQRLFDYATGAKARGLKVIIAGAGGAAHLPGMTAALTPLPVLGVPVQSRMLAGVDSLLSIVQMPAGVPVATFAIGQAGAVNAALYAAAILALSDEETAAALDHWRQTQTDAVAERPV
jgi:5-(carboxyamino)imidazole ribonucleotide mutase